MRRARAWFVLALLVASCVVPDVNVEPAGSGDDDSGSSSGQSNAPAGGKSNLPPPDGNAGDVGAGGAPESAGTSGDGASSGNPGLGGTKGVGGTTATGPGVSAFGKFCSDVVYQGQSIPLTLEIGTGSKRVTITADSGTCKPISGRACTPIPFGTAVPVSLLSEGEVFVTYPVDIEEGSYWIFLAYADGESIDVVGDPVTKDACELGYDGPTPAP